VEPEILIVTRLIPESDGTTCDQRLETVRGSRHVRILRVPFRDAAGNIVPHWISRFQVWPWLDRFATEAEAEIRLALGGRPDLIVGNYSDGNLVATRLAKSMGVTQGNIAHALEKSKYLFSNLYWRQLEPDYHFSLQFMADLIAMNQANFIVTSTSQEITGTDEAIGQYESYRFFTMPGLMQVHCGINLFHPRFNVVPPGVNEEVFFPYTRKRPARPTAALSALLFEGEGPDILGRLADPALPPIFTIARLDRIKNLTGLAEAYGKSQELQKEANLVLVASVLDPNRAGDQEERGEIERLHAIIEAYGLSGKVRWIGRFLDRESTGEVYRIMADRRGVFVQPALFEAFGLTVLEAMHSGLPVFATQFGGPLEIIEHEKSGFLVNPTDQEGLARRLAEFFAQSAAEPGYWQGFSRRGLKRAQSRFTWESHCRSLVRLAKVHGFWRYSTSQQAKSRLGEYCDLLYHFAFRERAKKMAAGQ
jgi:sucrose synthase